MHSRAQRGEATLVPLVLAGDEGMTVAGYMPAPEDLGVASGGRMSVQWIAVEGPHLRCVRRRFRSNKTGVVGISEVHNRSKGRHYYSVQLGARCRTFCIETLGRREAWYRALQLRAAHELKVAQANAAILAARAKHDGKGGAA